MSVYAQGHGPAKVSDGSGASRRWYDPFRTYYYEVLNYVVNAIVARVPCHAFRRWFLRTFYHWHIGNGSSLHTRFVVEGTPGPCQVSIGDHTVIGLSVYFAGVGYCADFLIGDNVNIAMEVLMTAGGHDIDPHGRFAVTTRPCIIEDHAIIFARASIIMATVGRGAVVLPGAVVVKDVEPFTIVGGVPAKPVGRREPAEDPTYRLKWEWRFH